MAIRKYLIKMNHKEAVYKIINDVDASAPITIALATDLKKANETLGTGADAPRAAIRCMEWTIDDNTGKITITRNAVVTHRLHSSTSLTQAYGADRDGEQYDIVVNMTGGTFILHILKERGYIPTFQPEQHGLE